MRNKDSKLLTRFKNYMRAATSVSFNEMARRGFAFQQKMKTDPTYSPDIILTIAPNKNFDSRPLNERAEYAAEYIFMSFIRGTNTESDELDNQFMDSAYQHTITMLAGILSRAGVSASSIYTIITQSWTSLDKLLTIHESLHDTLVGMFANITMQSNYNQRYMN